MTEIIGDIIIITLEVVSDVMATIVRGIISLFVPLQTYCNKHRQHKDVML